MNILEMKKYALSYMANLLSIQYTYLYLPAIGKIVILHV